MLLGRCIAMAVLWYTDGCTVMDVRGKEGLILSFLIGFSFFRISG